MIYSNKTKIISFILCLVLVNGLSAEDHKCNLWYKIPAKKGEIVFFAYQEAPFIRAKIGEWLKINLLEMRHDGGLLLGVEKIHRENNEIHVHVLLKNSNNEVASLKYNYFSEGKDTEISGVVGTTNNDTRLTITDDNGSRDLLVTVGSQLSDFKNKYSISRAMPLWKWDTAVIDGKF